MTALDNIKAALEAGPTEGPWNIDRQNWPFELTGRYHRVISVERFPTAFVPAWSEPAPGEVDGTEEAKANAAFIAACNPSAIRELLAYVERLERDLAHIASLAHEGGIANLNETGALTYIRRLSLRYWKSDGAQKKQQKRACDAIDAAMEQTK